ncbi:MAG: hypothetical protein ACE5G1_15945, partial [bacterium]
ALIGLILGILYSFGGLIIDALVSMGWITSAETPGLSFGTVLAFGALIGMPIIFATFGFIVGLIEAFLYNLFARWFGGIKEILSSSASSAYHLIICCIPFHYLQCGDVLNIILESLKKTKKRKILQS